VAAVALLVMILPAGVGANHDPDHAASGDWLMTFPPTPGRADTGKLHLAFTSKANYEAKAASLHYGSWAAGECGTGATQFYVGTFTRDKDSGLVIGCVSQGPSGLFYGVFQSTVYKVEGGLAGTLGAVMTAGVFPSQPQDEFNSQFLGHFAGDGAAPEEAVLTCSESGVIHGPLARSAERAQPALAACKIKRVALLLGSNQVKPADSERAVVGQTEYFQGVVKSKVVPALVVMVFPKDVAANDVFVLQSSSQGIGPCGRVATTADGRKLIACKLTVAAPTAGTVVFGVNNVPTSLGGGQLQVQLRVGKPLQAGQRVPDWLTDPANYAVDVETNIIAAAKPAASASPAPPPPAGLDPIQGHYSATKGLIGGTSPANLPLAIPTDATANIQPESREIKDVFFTTETSSVSGPNPLQLRLNKPIANTNVYDGQILLPGMNPDVAGAWKHVQLELIQKGQFAKDFPQYCAGYAFQAKATILCGTYDDGDKKLLVVMTRTGG
jgi:hypothetical protein